MGAQKNRLIVTVLLSTHNICIGWEIKKIIFQYTLLSGGLNSMDKNLLFIAGKGTDAKCRLTELFDLVPEIRHIGMWHTEMMKQMKVNIQVQEIHQLFHNINL